MAVYKFLVFASCLVLATLLHDTEAKKSKDLEHVGCYADSLEDRLLDSYYQIIPHILTPPMCVQLCRHLHYRYAGLQNGQECFCGDANINKHKKTTGCDMKCAGDSDVKCGGYLRVDVYKTGIPLTASLYDEHKSYQGCYKDFEDRVLSNYYQDYANVLTPEGCIKACHKKGYKLAGVEFGTQCFCGNELRVKQKVDNEDCNKKCPGNIDTICGGFWRIAVYKTGH